MKHSHKLLKRTAKLFFICLLFFPALASAQTTDWEKAKEKDGIVVYTRTLNGSKFKEFKAWATLSTDLHTVTALILDTKKVDTWYHQAADPVILKKIGQTEGYYRLDFDLPWPVDDRDEVIHWKLTQDPDTKVVIVDMEGVPKYAAEQDDRVRMPKLKSMWRLTPKPGGKVEVYHQAHVEPGGSVPAWLANSTVTDGPIESITGMKNNLKKYEGVKLPFIQE